MNNTCRPGPRSTVGDAYQTLAALAISTTTDEAPVCPGGGAAPGATGPPRRDRPRRLPRRVQLSGGRSPSGLAQYAHPIRDARGPRHH